MGDDLQALERMNSEVEVARKDLEKIVFIESKNSQAKEKLKEVQEKNVQLRLKIKDVKLRLEPVREEKRVEEKKEFEVQRTEAKKTSKEERG